jgi:hypothetical protein
LPGRYRGAPLAANVRSVVGASVIGYCREMSDDLLENQPGFWNDCKAWGEWMAERENHPEVKQVLKDLGCDALLSFSTEGVSDDNVHWVTPGQLIQAALRLRELVLNEDPRTVKVLGSYAIRANRVDPVHEELAQDLSDVAQIAEFFASQGVKEMTLQVNW